MGPRDLLRIVLPAVSLAIIAVGGVLFYLGSEVGLFIAAFGLLDLLTLPFILRAISRGRAGGAGPDPTASEPPELPTDPSYNPYARED